MDTYWWIYKIIVHMRHSSGGAEDALARHRLNVAGADERLPIASINVAADRLATMTSLKALVLGEAVVSA